MKTLSSLLVAVLLALLLALPAMAAETAPAPANPAPAAKVELLDLNSATEVQLKAIPEIGETYAKAIIAARPYAKKDQLKSRKIVPDEVYEKIKDRIVAKQPKP